jgi:predicted PurR-regulated permease PerM
MKRLPTRGDESRLLGIVAVVVVIAALYFARVVFIPLALSVLFSLLLTPAVSFFESIKFPRIIAVFLVVLVVLGLLGAIGWKASRQFVDLTDDLPAYQDTLQEKIDSIRDSKSQDFKKASTTVQEFAKDIGAAAMGSSAPAEKRKNPPALGSSASRPLAVQVVPPANPLESAETMVGPLATVGIVVIFTIFILMGRENLRDRLIGLAGRSRLNAMTQALDETTRRINRYLLLQLLVNAGYGFIIGVSLHFIGIPNASLWGVCAAILRFLPYAGPPLAALMPILLSLAIFPGWSHVASTALLYITLEVIVANVVEPLLYGAHLGLSPFAILVAAIFWTLIWGFPGLVLSTPLTVCLVVMGRYVPSLNFLNMLFGDDPVLSPHAQYYQRLLATDQNEAREVLERFLKDRSLEELYGSVVIPALGMAEQDRHSSELDDETRTFICQSTREIVEELFDAATEQDRDASAENSSALFPIAGETALQAGIMCIPARDDADDVVALLLAQLLQRRGLNADGIPVGTVSDMISQVADANPGIVCISALPPFAFEHARALYAKLRARFPELRIIVCIWDFAGDRKKAAIRLKLAEGHKFFTTLPEVLQDILAPAEKLELNPQ